MLAALSRLVADGTLVRFGPHARVPLTDAGRFQSTRVRASCETPVAFRPSVV